MTKDDLKEKALQNKQSEGVEILNDALDNVDSKSDLTNFQNAFIYDNNFTGVLDKIMPKYTELRENGSVELDVFLQNQQVLDHFFK